MEKEKLEELITEAEHEAKLIEQGQKWGSDCSQSEIFNAGIEEAFYRLRKLIQKV